MITLSNELRLPLKLSFRLVLPIRSRMKSAIYASIDLKAAGSSIVPKEIAPSVTHASEDIVSWVMCAEANPF